MCFICKVNQLIQLLFPFFLVSVVMMESVIEGWPNNYASPLTVQFPPISPTGTLHTLSLSLVSFSFVFFIYFQLVRIANLQCKMNCSNGYLFFLPFLYFMFSDFYKQIYISLFFYCTCIQCQCKMNHSNGYLLFYLLPYLDFPFFANSFILQGA